MSQGIIVAAAVAAAVGYLLWFYLRGRKSHQDCPDCPAKEKIAQARKRNPVR
jgi:hypothetical protein